MSEVETARWLTEPVAAKAQRHGTHRAATLAETWRRVAPLLPDVGVTRVADITGLDIIGIPVATAYRPNSRSLAVSQGKGATPLASRVSAAMEALEHDHAERVDLSMRLARHAELPRAVAPWALPRIATSTVDEYTALLWLTGHRVRDGAPVAVPYDVVGLDLTLSAGLTPAGLSRDSNGLASGNTASEAIVHALCEVIERDAAALWELTEQAGTRIDPASVTAAEPRELLDRCVAAGTEIALYDISSDIGVPAVLCYLVEAEPDPFRPLPPAAGLGCHPCAEVALSRAVTEAAQSRLITISGVRDDVRRDDYSAAVDVETATRVRDQLRDAARDMRSWPGGWGVTHDTLRADLDWLLDRLATAGLAEPVAVDLTRPDIGVPVLKVVVPGLEGITALTGGGTLPGERARAVMGRG
ncbi:YcaO-like family protein [Plantactinospora sp. WMMB782]|uniref:YcaO-like family protein n=1 Tax=Plantactinospora sp. WMMB782 TaxID=3404121 RepID=UPI003B933E28